MPKLHGAKKAAFLRRMAAGRRKAAGRKAPKRRTTKRRAAPKRRKTIKRRSPPRRMARRKTRRTSSKRSFASKIPLINNPTFRKAATGIGVATLGATALAFVAPSLAANPIVKPALAFLGGDIVGLAAQVLSSGGLSSLTGGSNGGGSNAGFA